MGKMCLSDIRTTSVSGPPASASRHVRRGRTSAKVGAAVAVATAAGIVTALLVNQASHGSPPAASGSTNTAGGAGTASHSASGSHASIASGQGATVAFDTKLVYPHSAGVVSAGFAAGGRVVAIDRNGTIYIWDTISGVTLSPDGRTQAVNDASERTYLWDTVRKAVAASWNTPGAAQNFAALSPDAKTLAESSGYGKISLWDVSSHLPAGSVPIPGGIHLGAVAISPDGKLLAEASLDSGAVYLWNLPTGKEFATLSDSGGDGADAIAFSPDGETLAVGDSDGSTYLWSIRRRLARPAAVSPRSSMLSLAAGRLERPPARR